MNPHPSGLVGLSLALTLGLHLHAASALTVLPHEATYRTSFKGIGVGDLKISLAHDATTDLWTYETHAQPTLLARLIVSPQSIEQSVFKVTAHGIEPVRYRITDGSGRETGMAALSYDWVNHRLTGQVKGSAVDLPFEGDLTDPLSIRAAVLFDLNAGRPPTEYAMIDDQHIKHYRYRAAGTARLATALGDLDTVLYDSDRTDSDGHGRSWRFWYAPALHYVIVRAEQRDAGHLRLLMTLQALHWTGNASTAGPMP